MSSQQALETPLHALHVELRAKMAPFAGYDMPIQYPRGVLKEHLHTRAAAGLFDVSHMGQITLRPRSGDPADAALALERLVPVDILGLKPGRQRYALFTNDAGGVRDDLMVANRGDHLLLVVNAACKTADEAHLRAHLSEDCEITAMPERALIALQGPGAADALARLAPGAARMRFMDVAALTVAGAPCIVTRSGYTGEDGYEIGMPNEQAEAVARALLDQPEVEAIGLGARDSLRLEAGLCLYGRDMDETTTPVEADLCWAMQKTRRAGGAREGGFPGAETILAQMTRGAARKRVGLRPEGRAPIREGVELFETEDAPTPAGRVTSGGFGPTVGAPVAMGYLPTALAVEGARVFAEVRGKRMAVSVAPTPFAPHRYHRG